MIDNEREQDPVTWHGPGGAWYAIMLIGFGLAGLAYLPLFDRFLRELPSGASGTARTITVLVIAGAGLLSGVAVALYPRPQHTRLGFPGDTLLRCVRGLICGIALAWSVFSTVDAFAFAVAPLANVWLTALAQILGLVIAAVLWDPGQKRILRSWYETAKGYSMSATGAGQ